MKTHVSWDDPPKLSVASHQADMAKVGAVGRAVSTDEAQLFSKDLSPEKGWLFQGVAYLCPGDPGSLKLRMVMGLNGI